MANSTQCGQIQCIMVAYHLFINFNRETYLCIRTSVHVFEKKKSHSVFEILFNLKIHLPLTFMYSEALPTSKTVKTNRQLITFTYMVAIFVFK